MKLTDLKGKQIVLEGDIVGTVERVLDIRNAGWHVEVRLWRHQHPSVFPVKEITHVEGKRVRIK